jgi:murein L,D-transpeptidase YcbB/YkuD
MEGVMSFKKETDTKPTKYFRPGRCNEWTHLKKYIRTKVNMERCRWIDPTLTRVSEYIVINIPALNWRTVNGKKELESNLLVGKNRLKQ